MPVPEVSPDYRGLSDWVVMQILDAIKGGSIQPGERLVEREIADRLAVSRQPVRDALHKLDKLGVVRQDSRATYIRSWSAEDAVDLLILLDALIALSVRLAAEQLTEEAIAELAAIIEETRSAIESGSTNVSEQVALDVKFHLVIAKASHNHLLFDLIEALWLPVQLYHQQFLTTVGRAYSLHEHEELLEVLKQGDPDKAEACARRHAQDGQAIVARVLREKADQLKTPPNG